MERNNKNFFLLMMGGNGTRFGASIPKQFIKVNNKPIFLYILESIEKLDYIDGVVVVGHADWISYILSEINGKFKKVLAVTEGGDCRSKSVYNGLKALYSYASDKDVVLIHDATHPHMDVDKLPELIEKVNQFGAATMVSSEYDTCYYQNENNEIQSVIERKAIAVGASPEGFLFDLIFPIYNKASDDELEKMTSAGAILIKNGQKMMAVHSDLLNLKITYPRDMELFNLLCEEYYYRIKK